MRGGQFHPHGDLLVALDSAWAGLLGRICAGPLIAFVVAAFRPPPQPRQKAEAKKCGKVQPP